MTVYVVYARTPAKDVLPLGYYEDQGDAEKHITTIKSSFHYQELTEKWGIEDVFIDTLDVVPSSSPST